MTTFTHEEVANRIFTALAAAEGLPSSMDTWTDVLFDPSDNFASDEERTLAMGGMIGGLFAILQFTVRMLHQAVQEVNEDPITTVDMVAIIQCVMEDGL